MPILTEAELRNRIRQPQQGLKLTLPKNARFSPSAQDFINLWKIEIVYSDQPENEPGADEPVHHAEKPEWDKPGSFPVVMTGEIPRCITCGMPVTQKPEHLTQVSADSFAPKNAPRIRLRGKMDTLHAFCLLTLARARSAGVPKLAALLDTLSAYCREITSAEYNERPVEPLVIAGLDETALRKATHRPDESVGISHIVPSSEDDEILLWLNYLRCLARETELVAMDAYAPEGYPVNDTHGILQAVNRLSSAIYYFELLYKAGKLN
jgi:ethanolamine utilization cobalamin adenosyltransferase